MLEIGIKGKDYDFVSKDNTAASLHSGALDIYSTPSMVTLMEKTCAESIEPELEDGYGSVGISLDIKHLSPSPIGIKINCESELIEIDRKRLVFKVKVFDEKGLIGEGTHQRYIVKNDIFLNKANSNSCYIGLW